MPPRLVKETDLQIEPCPFCGEPARLMHEPEDWGYTSGKWWVECTDRELCGAEIKAMAECTYELDGKPGYTYHVQETIAERVAFWNLCAL